MHKHPEHRDPSPNAWLGRVNVLLAWAAKARQESKEAKRRSDERRRVHCLGRWNCGVGSGANGFLAEGLGRADDYARKSRRGWHQGRLKVGKSNEG
jgi:hypothetical protein